MTVCTMLNSSPPPQTFLVRTVLICISALASTAGVLNTSITPATYCSFLDFNVNAQLNRFRLYNGGNQDARLLNEKWESIGIVTFLVLFRNVEVINVFQVLML